MRAGMRVVYREAHGDYAVVQDREWGMELVHVFDGSEVAQ